MCDVNETSYLATTAHALQATYISLKSVNNYGVFSWRTKYFFVSISPSNAVMILKLHAANLTRMLYRLQNFDWNRLKMKGTLLLEQNTFWSVSRLPFEAFTWNFISLFRMHELRSVPMGSEFHPRRYIVLLDNYPWLQTGNGQTYIVCSEFACTARFEFSMESEIRLIRYIPLLVKCP
jgi:hypothetical protein